MHGKLLKIIGLLLLVMFFNLALRSFAIANGDITLGMGVYPQIFEIDVWPGEEITKEIYLTNKSNVAIPIEIRVTDFTAEDNSGEMIFDEALQDPAVASRYWFKVKNPDLILESGEKRKISFDISVPGNAEPAGHYVTMLFEPRLPSFYFEEGQARAIPVVGVLFLISVKNLNPEPETGQKLEVVEFSLLKEERMVSLENFISRFTAVVAHAADFNITDSSPSEFILKIKNNDIYHIKPYGDVVIYNFFGKKVAEVEIPQKTILPGKSRIFPIKFIPEIPEKLKWLPASITDFLLRNLFIGKYEAKLELKAKSPLKAEILQPDIKDSLIFFSLSLKFWLPLIFIFIFLIFLSVKYRKRIKLSLKVLFSPN
jgi:hypothetical protein